MRTNYLIKIYSVSVDEHAKHIILQYVVSKSLIIITSTDTKFHKSYYSHLKIDSCLYIILK